MASTSSIACQLFAQRARPSRITATLGRLADAVGSAVQAANGLRAVGAGPVTFADAGGGLEVVVSVVRAAWQALVHLLVSCSAIFALPARFTKALTGNAASVTGTSRVLTFS